METEFERLPRELINSLIPYLEPEYEIEDREFGNLGHRVAKFHIRQGNTENVFEFVYQYFTQEQYDKKPEYIMRNSVSKFLTSFDKNEEADLTLRRNDLGDFIIFWESEKKCILIRDWIIFRAYGKVASKIVEWIRQIHDARPSGYIMLVDI